MSAPVAGFALFVVIVGLALTTLVTRTSFLVLGNRLKLGHRVEVALRYAPVCTLSAIIAPAVLLQGADYDFSPLNPRLIGVAGAALWLCFSRNMVGCLASGMLAFTVARLWL